MTNELLADTLVPIAARLVATVRDFGPDDVAAVLAEVPEHRHDALAVVLAAMVDPDARPSQLLAWTTQPVPSRDFTPPQYNVHTLSREALGRAAERRAEVGRLSALGLSAQQIAERIGITPRAVNRHRAAIRAAMGNGPKEARNGRSIRNSETARNGSGQAGVESQNLALTSDGPGGSA